MDMTRYPYSLDAGEFPAYDENIPTEHSCPKCGFKWSGKG